MWVKWMEPYKKIEMRRTQEQMLELIEKGKKQIREIKTSFRWQDEINCCRDDLIIIWKVLTAF